MPKILIADEGPGVRALLDSALSGCGVEVLFAPTGAQAVAQIEREAPVLVIADVYLPDMDGYRVCEFVKSHPRLRATPVLLMADVVDATITARAARVRPDDVLRKPFAADQLLGRIQSLVPEAMSSAPVSSRPADIPGAPAPTDAKELVGYLGRLPGVSLSVLVDAEGFLIDCGGDMTSEADAVGAVVSCLATSTDRIGRELGHGRLRLMSLEYDGMLVIVADAGSNSTLGVALEDPTSLEAVHRAMAKVSPPSHEGLAAVGSA
jgi:CheY-like chemotaxis protein/predicted regulator of Ras-like GTPase activity (Roadblock/LC7/MglB family)